MQKKLNVAVIGSGKIGIDLICKIRRSEILNCVLVSGRREDSEGLRFAKQMGLAISTKGIDAIFENDNIDIIFDATSAAAHIKHWEIIKGTSIIMIDLTPSIGGKSIVPTVNMSESQGVQHINMISCGGQLSVPIIAAVSEVADEIDYIELVSSISSISAGPATRANLDEYIHNTEGAILNFSKSKRSKVIINLNPAKPPVNMKTTISFQIKNPQIDSIIKSVIGRVELVKKYVPGIELLYEPKVIEKNRVVVMIEVEGAGDYLPKHSGNLDIINSAAVAVAEFIANY